MLDTEEYWAEDAGELIRQLRTSENGISEPEAAKRLKIYGPNEIKEEKKTPKWAIFLRQFNSFIIYILIAAVIISAAVPAFEKGIGGLSAEDIIDPAAIFIILILNAAMGFVQEYRAEKAIEALKKLASLKAVVVRDGKEKEIDSSYVVPGDIISLSVGQKVPADCRIISISGLETQESALTGESTPVQKSAEALSSKAGKVLAQRINTAFAGTIVTKGRAHAVAAGTGMKTEIGRIARQIQEAGSKTTPLQKKLASLGRNLGVITIIICIAVVAGGIAKGGSWPEWLMIGISLAVAAIPEGLPAVVTISLALGVQKMARKHALVRKLASVQTLGATTAICTDKTGTLTKNEMTVRSAYVCGKIIDATGSGYIEKGEFLHDGKKYSGVELETLLEIGAACNNSSISGKKVIGDPTEACLIVSAKKAGLNPEMIAKTHKRLGEIEFTSERKMMSILVEKSGKKLVFSKGAPEILVKKCSKILEDGKEREISKNDIKKILEANRMFAEKALRVLAFAYKKSAKLDEKGLVFAGLQAMMDPPRPEAKAAVKKCESAGIRVIMITGDYEVTANAIAKELGIGGESISGDKLREIKDLSKIVGNISIYARVNPEDKIRIVEALKKKGEVVAMTGDGVNDAPALKKADIGIAMGRTGTDVAKEASDMVLTDDNFASIVGAVEEGRAIFDNIKKFVNYLLSSNMGEVLILFTAMIIGFTYEGVPVLPIAAIQILWLNLITDGLPALALGIDPASPGIMKRPPRSPKSGIISKSMMLNIALIGILMAAAVISLFSFYLPQGLAKAQTIAFTSIVMLEFARVYIVREGYGLGFFSNIYLLGAIAASLGLQALVIYTPASAVFRTIPLSIAEWGVIAAVTASAFFLGMFIQKIIKLATHEMD